MPAPLEGIIPALHTAFGPDEEINVAAQRALARRLLAEGVHGLFVCGTTGEFPFLSLEERERLAELAVEEAGGRVPVIIHVGAPRPRDAVRLARHAARLGAAAISAVPPCYYSSTRAAVIDHIREIAAATALPFLYYHIPDRTAVALDERLLEAILRLPNVAGLKYSSNDLGFLNRVIQIAGPSFRVFCGSDQIFADSLAAGVCGAVGSTYNFLAQIFVRLWSAFREGKTNQARGLQELVNRVIVVLNRYPSIAASKEALRILGADLGQPRRPGSRLDESERAGLERDLTAAGLFDLAPWATARPAGQ